MKTVLYSEFGGPSALKVEHCPPPEPMAGQVLIKVAGVGLNPVDVKGMYGKAPWLTGSMPTIPGVECSGTIEKLGRGVVEFKIGDEVYGCVTKGMAEYVVADVNTIAMAPPSLDLQDAGAVPVAASTAYQALFDQGQLQSGQRVLIHAAAGGVGSFAVQLAKWKNATVIGTASASNEHFVRELGVDEFVDYKARPFEEGLEPVDLVFDTLGGDTSARSEKILKKGGRLIAVVAAGLEPELFERNGKMAKFWSMKPNPEDLKLFCSLFEDLHLKVVITGQVHFDNVRKGYELMEGGHVRGKLLCTP